MRDFDHTFSVDFKLNELFLKLVISILDSEAKSFSINNFILRNINTISELKVESNSISEVNLDFNENLLYNEEQISSSRRFEIIRHSESLKRILLKVKDESNSVQITIRPEKKPSFETIHQGLHYRSHNETEYSNIPSTYTLGNY